MGQTRVKAGHIELVQGSKYTKNVKQMRWICARDKRAVGTELSWYWPSKRTIDNTCRLYPLQLLLHPLEICLNW